MHLHLRAVLLLCKEGVVIVLVHACKGVVNFTVRGLILADRQKQVAEGGIRSCVVACLYWQENERKDTRE